MLIRFSVANFKSFRGKQTFSMEADADIAELPGNTVLTPAGTLVKTAAVYGHNASGKTNLIAGLEALAGLLERPDTRSGFISRLGQLDPHRLAAGAEDPVCRFEVELLLDGRSFRYLLVADSGRVLEESLDATSQEAAAGGTSWKPVFHRKRGSLDFFDSEEFGSREKQNLLEETLNEQRPLLAFAVEMNTAIAAKLQRWFTETLDIHRLPTSRFVEKTTGSIHRELMSRLDEDAEFKERFLSFFAAADLGVTDANPREVDEEPDGLVASFLRQMAKSEHEMSRRAAQERLDHPEPQRELRLSHRCENGGEIELPWESESAGTRRFVDLLAMLLLQADGPPRTLVIDELDASLSPDLLERIVRLFHDPTVNRSASQLIFATHDRSLLDADELLRRDQVWVTQKRESGDTELYRLSDFDDGPWADGVVPSRRFATGRYGGVAEFGFALDALPRPRERHVLQDSAAAETAG